jgi:hemerythrin-like domain-containing protein
MADKPVDFTMNTLMHGAFKRELGRIQVGVTTLSNDRGQETAGLVRRWQFFSTQLARHHEGEDLYIWPLVRERASKPDEMVILDAMEAEHEAMQGILDTVDERFAAMGRGEDVDLAELQNQLKDLNVVVRGHCEHEERDGATLVTRYVRSSDLKTFHKFTRSTDDARLVFPWICDGAPQADQVAAWGVLPGFVRVFAKPLMSRKYVSFKAEIS